MLDEPRPITDGPLPDEQTQLPGVQALAPPRRMRYLESFRYVFEQPDWIKTLIFGGLCLLIPVLGPIAIFGYEFEVVEALHRRRNQPYPPFEFKRFASYAKRGVWMLIFLLMAQTVLQIPVQLILQFGIMGLMMLYQADPQTGAIVAAIAVPLVVLMLLSLLLGLSVFFTPIFLRAGLTQDFALIFRTAWIQDFLRKTWLESLLSALFLSLSLVLLSLIGLLACGIGIYPAAMFYTLANAHLYFQLYEIYLERGGEPIALQPLPAEVPPVGNSLARSASEGKPTHQPGAPSGDVECHEVS